MLNDFTNRDRKMLAPMGRAVLRGLPPAVLSRVIQGLLRSMARRRPKLFENLASLPGATIDIAPTDLSYRFRLSLGDGRVDVMLMEPVSSPDSPPADAVIAGSLARLLELLEGRTDGDTLFFSRELRVTGRSDVVVALRNTLDRQEIDILDDVSAMAGPFQKPARQALHILGNILDRVFGMLLENQ